MTDTIEVQFVTSEGPIRAKLAVPPRPMRLAELAMGFVGLSSKLSDIETRVSEKKGLPIACTKGCGACCRQLLQVSAPEAWLLADLVRSMPSARQALVRGRFADAIAKIAESPMKEVFEREAFASADVMTIGVDYFQLGIPCPFLEEESCSIHPQRPSICREYLVTSPASHCAALGKARIDRVPLNMRLSQAFMDVAAQVLGTRAELIPMPFALEWADQHREDGVRTFDPRMLMEALFAELAKGSLRG